MNLTNAADTGSLQRTGLVIRIGQHAAFWIAAAVAMLALYTRMLGSPTAALWMMAATSPLFFGAVYFTLYVTLPRALYTRRYGLLLLLALYTLLGVIFLELLLFILLTVGMIPFPDVPDYIPPQRAFDAVLLSAGPAIVTLVAVAVKLVQRARDSERAAQRLRQEKLEAELAMLRAQVHPHFLFNTLNNLYALTLKKSDQASEVVLKLSALLDYMLYESRADEVPIEREADLIESYLDLERMRYGEQARITFRREIQATQHIAPLLFLPLVENSFKHGMSRSSGDAWVDISLICRTGEIFFSVRNSLPDDRETDTGDRAPQGLGLKNVRERLDMLYPGEAAFSADRQDTAFEVTMRIKTFTIPSREER